ncbi:MAG: hypothetical protein AB7K86_08510 [Rhodospirillales bacterium]
MTATARPAYCPVQGKKQFPSPQAAYQAMSRLTGRKDQGRRQAGAGQPNRPGRAAVYRCADCGLFHMTHRHWTRQRVTEPA